MYDQFCGGGIIWPLIYWSLHQYWNSRSRVFNSTFSGWDTVRQKPKRPLATHWLLEGTFVVSQITNWREAINCRTNLHVRVELYHGRWVLFLVSQLQRLMRAELVNVQRFIC